jgi:hypothetical protein
VLMLLFLHKTMSRICMLSIVILDLCFEHSCERFHLCTNIAVRVLQACENHAGFYGNCVTSAEIVFLLLPCQDTQGL